MHLPRYQANLEKMKKSGYEVIEYAKKSKGVSYLLCLILVFTCEITEQRISRRNTYELELLT